jgi:methionyl-tRNA synthetase
MQELFNQYPWLILLLQAWVIPWKGIALWIASRRENKLWFIALLLLNTVGILEIIYIFFIAKHKFKFPQAKKK